MPEYWRPAGREVGVKLDVLPPAPAIPCPGLDELLAAEASDELAQVSA
jgi:hypothetical protein